MSEEVKPVDIATALQLVEEGAVGSVPVYGQGDETVAWLVPAAKYQEMVKRLEALKDVVLLPVLTDEEIRKRFLQD